MEGWISDKLDNLFETGSGTTPQSTNSNYYDGNINWLLTGDLNDGIITSTSKKITSKALSDYSTLKLYPKNSVVIALYGATIGKLGFLDIESTTNQACCVLYNSKRMEQKYLFYNLLFAKNRILALAVGGGQPNISQNIVKNFEISFPESQTEQQKIASILSIIDQTIDQTEQLIAKYKNIKKGLMHDLLTYGIDKYGTIRNPQIHTLVEKKGLVVPEEWEVEEFSKHILLLNGGTPSTSNPDFWNGNIPWLSVDDFNTGKRFVSDANKKITEYGLKYSSTRLLSVGDIIISARGTVGVIAQLGKEMAFNQSCYGIRNNSVKIYANDFIYFYLKFYFQSKGVIKTGSTFDTITKNTFDEIYISLPSKSEQQKIVSILEQHDNLIEAEQTNLAKLQNMKQGLMADLLTGKVRVKI